MRTLITQEDYLKRCKDVHGNRYIYDKTVYKNKRTKVIITCRIHGDFECLPRAHYANGTGCKQCGYKTGIRAKGLPYSGTGKHQGCSTFLSFRRRTRKYDNLLYKEAKAKEAYRRKQAAIQAKEAAKVKVAATAKERTEAVTRMYETSTVIHEGVYTYDESVTITNIEQQKINITCSIHGVFKQTMKHHLKGQGCPKCGVLRTQAKAILPFSEVESRLKAESLDDRYIPIESSYTKYSDPMLFTCTVCDRSFSMIPHNLIHQKQNCPYCRGMYKKVETVVEKLTKKHPNVVLHPTVIKHAHEQLSCTCAIHGIFTRTVGDLLNGFGCRECASKGFQPDKPAILYYLSINNGQAYKIGVTNRSVAERFSNTDLNKIQTVRTWYYDIGLEAYEQEQIILQEFKHLAWTHEDLLENGNTELFCSDILNLDTQYKSQCKG